MASLRAQPLASILLIASLDRIKLAQHRAQHRFEIDIDRLYAAQTRLLAQYLTDEAALTTNDGSPHPQHDSPPRCTSEPLRAAPDQAAQQHPKQNDRRRI